MCTGLEVGLLVAASATVSSVGGFVGAQQATQAAETEMEFRQYQIGVQNEQLAEDRKLIELQALEQENARRDRSRQVRAANEAFLAGSGVRESLSFQVIDNAANEALKDDISNIRLQGAVSTGRVTDQIAVNRVESQFQRTRASQISSQAYTGAAFNAASAVTRAGSSYAMYRTR